MWYKARRDKSCAHTTKECGIVSGRSYSSDEKVLGDICQIRQIRRLSFYNS